MLVGNEKLEHAPVMITTFPDWSPGSLKSSFPGKALSHVETMVADMWRSSRDERKREKALESLRHRVALPFYICDSDERAARSRHRIRSFRSNETCGRRHRAALLRDVGQRELRWWGRRQPAWPQRKSFSFWIC